MHICKYNNEGSRNELKTGLANQSKEGQYDFLVTYFWARIKLRSSTVMSFLGFRIECELSSMSVQSG